MKTLILVRAPPGQRASSGWLADVVVPRLIARGGAIDRPTMLVADVSTPRELEDQAEYRSFDAAFEAWTGQRVVEAVELASAERRWVRMTEL